ncbi:shikimate O-hydroxycinnamoyltransferase-like [Magnolia sinica]|uniref:shikimate O-hydroxycinnamoyltransferase-like n=1 Tax=Magnolia sinica TaxID=86752 RepID=UPI00265804FA|nr:shikimate O-hydroxycinnamoyltransferase-like [Magnolia sinica]
MEYSNLIHWDSIFSAPGICSHAIKQPRSDTTCVIYMLPGRIDHLKTEALKDNPLMNCTTLSVLAANIWKARTIATGLPDDRISTMLFPVVIRKRVVPHVLDGFAGNAVMPGFVRASTHELKTSRASVLVGKIQEGLERLDDGYVKSGIDWLEVHKGVPCMVDSFSVVAWWKLGLEMAHFGWGPIRCITLAEMKPGLVFLLPGEKDEGGINVCLELPSDHMKEFYKLMMED